MPDILLLLTLVTVAAFVQTVSGFAFGLICMAGAGALGLMPISQAALLVSLLTLTNIVFALPGKLAQVNWRAVGLILISGGPAIAGGLFLLSELSERNAAGLQTVLGVCIGLCCLMMLRKSTPLASLRGKTSKGTLLSAGIFGGVLGGMFSTFGPPVIYMLYRQGWAKETLRATLLALFLCTNALRSSMALSVQWPDGGFWYLFFLSAPTVVAVTLLSRRINLPSLRWPVMLVLGLASLSMVYSGFNSWQGVSGDQF